MNHMPPSWERRMEEATFGGFVLPVEDPDAKPASHARPPHPMKMPKCPWSGGWSDDQLAKEWAWKKKEYNRKQRQASKFLFEAYKDDEGRCWMVVIGPKIFFKKKRPLVSVSSGIKIRPADGIVISLLSKEFGEPLLSSKGEVLFKREIGWPVMSRIPQYEV